jgi:ElaB/YqjD/DUF883 family membrane-anchored ribosome-binding protein
MATMNDPLATSDFNTNTGMNDTSANGGVKAKLNDATSHVKNTAADFGRSAVQGIDRNLKSAANALESTASTLRSKLPTEGGKVSGVAQTAADKLDATAQYLKTHDSHDLMMGVESWARRNPGAALGGALAVGFFIGMSLNRDRRSY